MKVKKAGSKLIAVAATCALIAGFGTGSVAAQDKGPRASPEQVKAMETWTETLAIQAATDCPARSDVQPPLYRGLRRQFQAQPDDIWRKENISTPKIAAESGYVSPNLDVVYGFGFADLGQEPVILTAPDSNDRYYMIEICRHVEPRLRLSCWGRLRLQGRQVRVRWTRLARVLPPDVTRIDAPTRWIEFQPRVNVKSDSDLPAARKC